MLDNYSLGFRMLCTWKDVNQDMLMWNIISRNPEMELLARHESHKTVIINTALILR